MMDPADVRARSQATPSSPRAPAWLARVVMTIAAWPFAFLTVLALFTFLDDELGSLPLAGRALVVSGVLVTLMANVVIPVLNDVVHRSLERIAGGSRVRMPDTHPEGGRR